jgi:hypothetical protein
VGFPPAGRPAAISLRQRLYKDQVGTVVRRNSRWYFPPAVSGWTIKRPALCALLVMACGFALAACGGGERLDVNEPRASFTVDIPSQSFPATQTMSQHSHLVLAVRNDSNRTIPNVAVTICNVTCQPGPGETYATLAKAGEGTYAAPFASGSSGTVATSSQVQPPAPTNFSGNQQIWIVDRPPGPCTGQAGYSCAGGSFGGAVTYDANTWALGPLKPGATAHFDWAVTAVRPGHWTVAWEVSAGLSGKARAVLPNGSQPSGAFPVTISNTPAQSYVNNNGAVVSSPNGR